MKVRIITHRSVSFEGHDYTQADGLFELPDGIARILIKGGTCGEPDLLDRLDSQEEDDEEESGSLGSDEQDEDDDFDEEDEEDEDASPSVELLSLLPASRADALYAVLAEAGYTTAESVLDADIDDLIALRGIGEKTAAAIKDAAFAALNER